MTKLKNTTETPMTADPLLGAANIKAGLVNYLSNCNIDNIHDLWALSKAYFRKDPFIDMGGSYASFGDYISVHLLKDGESIRFKVSMSEVR